VTSGLTVPARRSARFGSDESTVADAAAVSTAAQAPLSSELGSLPSGQLVPSATSSSVSTPVCAESSVAPALAVDALSSSTFALDCAGSSAGPEQPARMPSTTRPRVGLKHRNVHLDSDCVLFFSVRFIGYSMFVELVVSTHTDERRCRDGRKKTP